MVETGRPAGGAILAALALIGVVVVLKTPDSPWPWPQTMADGLALMGGACFALTNVMLRRLQQAPPAAGMLAMFGGGTVMATLTAQWGVQHGVVGALPPFAAEWLGWVGALSLFFLVGNVGLQYGAARLSASATSIIMLTEVIFASTSAVLLGAGELNLRVAVGGGLILLASLLATVSFGHPPRAST